MATDPTRDDTILTDEVAENSGARMTKTKHNPEVSHEEAQNAAAGEGPNAAGEGVPSTVEDHIPSSDSPEPTDLPSGDVPRPE